jgi:hypothetical protein
MENESDKILEEIKSGAILENGRFVDYSKLELSKNEKNIMESMKDFHGKECILPRIENLVDSIDLSEHQVRKFCNCLIEEDALCKFTFRQLFRKYGSYGGLKPRLPQSLDIATKREIRTSRHYDFKKKMNGDPYAHNLPRFYLALVTETDVAGRKVPWFRKIFDFLPYYQVKPLQIKVSQCQ